MMSIRAEVREFVRLGPLVNENAAVTDDAVGALLERQHQSLQCIEPPVTFEEAHLLMKAFPPDSDTCFGLAWTLLHLIETAPGFVLDSEPPPDASWWVHYMWGRIENSKRLGMTGPLPSAPPWPADPACEPAPGQSVWLLDSDKETLLRGTIKAKLDLKPGTWWNVAVGASLYSRVTSELRRDTGEPPPV